MRGTENGGRSAKRHFHASGRPLRTSLLASSHSDPGSRVDEIAMPPSPAIRTDDSSLIGRIIHIDRVGNAITTIHADQLSSSSPRINIAGREIDGWCGGLTPNRDGRETLIGSPGFLEVAVNCGSAADTLGLRLGDSVSVQIT
jgi:S-adenosyl-L-methionine hydrolase (adenosine-forming)